MLIKTYIYIVQTHKQMHNVYISNSPKITPLIKSVKSLSCCVSANQTNTLSKAKNKKLIVWSGIRFGFEDSAMITKSDRTHSYRRWSYNTRYFKTLAGNSKQKF